MTAFNHGMNQLFDLLLAPVAAWPVLALAAAAVVTAVWSLLLFKAVTPQQKLVTVRDRLFGHIYEMGLYQDHLRVVARIQWDLIRTNGRYLSLTLPALLVLLVPMVLTLAQLEARFGHRPLRSGEETVLSVTLAADAPVALADLELELPPQLVLRAGPVRDRAAGAVAWRLQLVGAESAVVVVRTAAGEVVRRVVPGGDRLMAVGETSRTSGWAAVLSPGTSVLPGAGPLAAVRLTLPTRVITCGGFQLDWLVGFMVFSLAAGLVIKSFLGVSI